MKRKTVKKRNMNKVVKSTTLKNKTQKPSEVKSSKTRSSKPRASKTRSSSIGNQLGKIFTLHRLGPEKKNFSTSFEYGNLMIHAKSKDGLVTINIKMVSKNFNFSGVVTLNEKSFSQLQDVTDHLMSNIRRLA